MVPRIVDKQARRAAIVEAARSVFAGRGFQGASLDDIARAADVAKGTLYLYFSNKEELFYATFQSFQFDMVRLCESSIEREDSAGDKLRACLAVSVDTLCDNIELYPLTLEVWAAASSGPARERFAAAMKDLYARFRATTAELIETGKESGEFAADVDSEAVAAWLVGGLDGLMLQYWFDRDIELGRWVDSFLATVMRGIESGKGRG